MSDADVENGAELDSSFGDDVISLLLDLDDTFLQGSSVIVNIVEGSGRVSCRRCNHK